MNWLKRNKKQVALKLWVKSLYYKNTVQTYYKQLDASIWLQVSSRPKNLLCQWSQKCWHCCVQKWIYFLLPQQRIKVFQVDPTPPPHQVNEVEKESIEFNRKDAFKYENKELSFFKTLVDYHRCLANEWAKLGVEEHQYRGNLSVRKKRVKSQS